MTTLEVKSFSPEDRQEIALALSAWAEFHPAPDRGVIGLTDGTVMTPRTIALSLNEKGSVNGERFLRLVSIALSGEESISLAQFLSMFANEQGLMR